MIKESQFNHGDITHITIHETNEDGKEICFGCKELVNPQKAYVYSDREGTTVRHYTVHKYCGIRKNSEVIQE